MKKKYILGLILAILPAFLLAEYNGNRSFDEIFPNLPPEIRAAAFTDSGHISYSSWQEVESGNFTVIGREGAAIDPQVVNAVLARRPGYLVETLMVIPPAPHGTSLLEVYNALGKIRGLEGRLYHSSRRNRYIPLFEEATRIAGERNNTPVPDPPPAGSIPASETIFLRLRDANFGNSFYRADIYLAGNGLVYRMSNSRNLTFLFVPVVREGNLVAQLYFEIIQEGILVYGLSGVDVPRTFSSMVHMGSSIGKRLEVIISWVVDGLNAR